MKQTTEIQFFAAVFIFLIVLFSIFSFVGLRKREQILTVETDAEIVDVQPRYTRETDGLSVRDKI